MTSPQKCPVCKSKFHQSFSYLNKAYTTSTALHDLTILVCRNCGLGRAVPEKAHGIMMDFYNTQYRAPGSAHGNRYATIPLFDKYSVNPRALSQWMLLKTFRSFGSDDIFCDIGPGGGATFRTAKFLGLNMKMFAYEPDSFSSELLLKQEVSVFPECFHPHVKIPSVKFSAIIMSHSLEHFCASDAIGVLRKAKEILLKDGILLIEVPNTPMESFGKMRLDDSPHLTFWTKISLKKAIEFAGMQVLFISTTGEKYLDWWNRSQKANPNAHFNDRIKIFIKRALPTFLLAPASKLVRGLISHKSIYEWLSSYDFQYGEDNICIRAVCCTQNQAKR